MIKVGNIAVQLLKLNFQEPLIYVLDILRVVYTTCDAEGLALTALLPYNLVSLLFNMYMDCQSTYRLKTRILDVLISVLDKDFMEQHFDFGNKDLFERLKKDFLSESVPKQFEPHFYKLFQEIVNFLVALFEYNDSATNIVISEDIKIEYILMESLVNRKNSAKV